MENSALPGKILSQKSIINIQSKEDLELLARSLQTLMATRFKFDSNKIGVYRDIAAQLAGHSNGFKTFLKSLETEAYKSSDQALLDEFIHNPTFQQLKEHVIALCGHDFEDEWCQGTVASSENELHDFLVGDIELEGGRAFLMGEQVFRHPSKEAGIYTADRETKCRSIQLGELSSKLKSLTDKQLKQQVFLKLMIDTCIDDQIDPEAVTANANPRQVIAILSRLVGITEAYGARTYGDYSPVDFLSKMNSPDFMDCREYFKQLKNQDANAE
jgi:hypothetical protein